MPRVRGVPKKTAGELRPGHVQQPAPHGRRTNSLTSSIQASSNSAGSGSNIMITSYSNRSFFAVGSVVMIVSPSWARSTSRVCSQHERSIHFSRVSNRCTMRYSQVGAPATSSTRALLVQHPHDGRRSRLVVFAAELVFHRTDADDVGVAARGAGFDFEL